MDERVRYCLDAEIHFARAVFPQPKHTLAALVEEVGELAQALLDNERGKKTKADVFAEAIQVMNMAYRVAMDGDESFPSYKFLHSSYQAFNVNKDVEAAKLKAYPKGGDKNGR